MEFNRAQLSSSHSGSLHTTVPGGISVVVGAGAGVISRVAACTWPGPKVGELKQLRSFGHLFIPT